MIARIRGWIKRQTTPKADECAVLERAHRQQDQARELAALQRKEAELERRRRRRMLTTDGLDGALFDRKGNGT